MKLKRYPKYKDSGIQWLGDIPEGWEVHKLKYLLSTLQSGKRESDETAPVDKGAFSIGGEHINWDGTLKLDNIRLLSYEYYNSMNNGKIRKGDVLLVKDGATIGKTAIVRELPYEKMAVNEHVFLMRPNKRIDSNLLYYLIYSDSGFKQIQLTETGSAQGGINTTFADNVLFSIPKESNEINHITSFLDNQTSKIDKTIEKDRQLIKLLKEKRTALINHVVTKGLDPNAKMKDSGIDWIGEIPEEWEVRKLKFVASLYGRIGFRGYTVEDLVEEGKGALTIGGKHISKDNKLDLTNPEYLSWEKYKESPEIMINTGDILITQRGTLGKVVIIETDIGPATINPNMIVIKKIKCYNKFLYYFLISDFAVKNVEILTSQTAVPMISQEQVSNFIILLPPLPEQQAIVQYLDKETSKIDKTIKKIEKHISLLEEYKRSLIHHVITGKVDVREVKV